MWAGAKCMFMLYTFCDKLKDVKFGWILVYCCQYLGEFYLDSPDFLKFLWDINSIEVGIQLSVLIDSVPNQKEEGYS